jgi:hypothetical protein
MGTATIDLAARQYEKTDQLAAAQQRHAERCPHVGKAVANY